MLARQQQAAKETKLPSSMSLCSLQAEGMVQIKGVSSSLKIWIKGVNLPTSKFWASTFTDFKPSQKKSLTGVPCIFRL